MSAKKPARRPHDAGNGQFVTKKVAQKRPGTTVWVTDKKGSGK